MSRNSISMQPWWRSTIKRRYTAPLATLGFLFFSANADADALKSENKIVQPLWRTMIAAARADMRSNDEFTDKTLPSIYKDNDAIHYRRPLVYKDTKNYSYKDRTLTLYAATTMRLNNDFNGKPTMLLFSEKRYGNEYRASNAFGISAEVTNWHREDDGLIVLHAPKLDQETNESSSIKFYSYKVSLEGAAAKALISDVDIIIDAVVARPPDGDPVICKTTSNRATLDDPESWTINGCYIGAKISHISLVTRSTGLVIKEWK